MSDQTFFEALYEALYIDQSKMPEVQECYEEMDQDEWCDWLEYRNKRDPQRFPVHPDL